MKIINGRKKESRRYNHLAKYQFNHKYIQNTNHIATHAIQQKNSSSSHTGHNKKQISDPFFHLFNFVDHIFFLALVWSDTFFFPYIVTILIKVWTFSNIFQGNFLFINLYQAVSCMRCVFNIRWVTLLNRFKVIFHGKCLGHFQYRKPNMWALEMGKRFFCFSWEKSFFFFN